MALTKYALSFPAVADGVKMKLKEIKGQMSKERQETGKTARKTRSG